MSETNRPLLHKPLLLKLGGSLITDKRQPEMVREQVLRQVAAEIATVRQQQPTLRLVIGHGSGSFGHLHAKRHGTRDGVYTAEGWLGFAHTADAAARLNRAVVGALLLAGIPAWGIQPGAIVRAQDGAVANGFVDNIRAALERDIVPVIYGDTVLDDQRGGTIASTEELFEWLLPQIQPARVVLAGEVDGIYSADPLRDPAAVRIPQITPQTVAAIAQGLGESHGVDVTGGMAAKVAQSLRMVAAVPGLDVLICSGLQPGQLTEALLTRNTTVGTQITAVS